MSGYPYIYQPTAPTERNVRESMAMDGLRAKMAPTSESLRK